MNPLDEIDQLLSRVPPYYPSWDYTRTVEFKKAAAEALKQRKGNNPNKLDSAVNILRSFYQLKPNGAN